jgi:hypothetical protein
MSQVPVDTEPTLTSSTTQVYVGCTRFFFFPLFSHGRNRNTELGKRQRKSTKRYDDHDYEDAPVGSDGKTFVSCLFF